MLHATCYNNWVTLIRILPSHYHDNPWRGSVPCTTQGMALSFSKFLKNYLELAKRIALPPCVLWRQAASVFHEFQLASAYWNGPMVSTNNWTIYILYCKQLEQALVPQMIWWDKSHNGKHCCSYYIIERWAVVRRSGYMFCSPVNMSIFLQPNEMHVGHHELWKASEAEACHQCREGLRRPLMATTHMLTQCCEIFLVLFPCHGQRQMQLAVHPDAHVWEVCQPVNEHRHNQGKR
jgi:hypothetical protein